MASSIIHMCVAKKINKYLNRNHNMFLLGAIAPDISKLVGESRTKSHFLTEDEMVDLDAFLKKYKNKLDDDFMMGYYVHLYTDFLWDKYFLSEIIEKNSILLIDGGKVEATEENYEKLIYNDYTNLNIKLIDLYNLDLSLFYNEPLLPDIEMDEIPISKLKILLDNVGVIIENTKEKKAYTFKIENIEKFIETSSELILSKIKLLEES